ncbi:hypothetical protein [Candidatus Entotheonella palauensis]|uniref:Uncharacterized protein n=1 Tax=Candidatus Entotheonella gemina TaxID=1429439 RepID=W4M2D1_9BACT|nr:hypothetical protein [Candidatus Entotheonella palauensis]ETX04350.1 MAG: hypothetical protein ETSY2_29295 [Candidatus Entotheonella gemina]
MITQSFYDSLFEYFGFRNIFTIKSELLQIDGVAAWRDRLSLEMELGQRDTDGLPPMRLP